MPERLLSAVVAWVVLTCAAAMLALVLHSWGAYGGDSHPLIHQQIAQPPDRAGDPAPR